MNVTRCTAHEIIVEQRMLLELVIQQEDSSLEGQRIASRLLQQLRHINLLKHWLQQHALFNGLTFIQAAIFSSTFVALRCTGYTTVMLFSDRIQELLTASLASQFNSHPLRLRFNLCHLQPYYMCTAAVALRSGLQFASSCASRFHFIHAQFFISSPT